MEARWKWLNALLLAALAPLAVVCYRSAAADPVPELEGNVDVDFTKLNATMGAARMFELMSRPKAYEGRRIRLSGRFVTIVEKDSGARRFACLVADPGGCCVQGVVEFTLKADPKKPPRWPDDYPAPDETFSVQGKVELAGDKRPAPVLRDAEVAVAIR